LPNTPAKVAADLGARRAGHLLDADDERDAGALRLDRLDRLVDRGRAGRAGVLDADRGLEAEALVRLQHQRGGEVLWAKAGVEMAEHDLVDVARLDAGVLQRLVGNADDQALHGLVIELPEGRMGPADDAGGHGAILAIRSRECGQRRRA
jgi:hypothetical protein